MGFNYNFVCKTCNEIYDIGKHKNACSLIPYLAEQHHYCDCGTCTDDDIRYEDHNSYANVNVYASNGFNEYCQANFILRNPKIISFRQAYFWDVFRQWRRKKAYSSLRDLKLRFKLHFLQPDWYEEDEEIDKAVGASMSRIGNFIDRVEGLNEETIDAIINEVLKRCPTDK